MTKLTKVIIATIEQHKELAISYKLSEISINHINVQFYVQ